MAGIRQGFFTTSSQAKKEERKQDANSPNPTSSSNISSSQLGGKKPHPENTPATQEKPGKKKKLTQIEEVSRFNLESEINISKLVVMFDDLRNEVLQLKQENMMLREKLEHQEFKMEQRIEVYERDQQGM